MRRGYKLFTNGVKLSLALRSGRARKAVGHVALRAAVHSSPAVCAGEAYLPRSFSANILDML